MSSRIFAPQGCTLCSRQHWRVPVLFLLLHGTVSPAGGGCAARFSKSWPYFRPKNVIFPIRFQIWPLKSIPVFRPLSSLLRLGHKQKISSNAFRVCLSLFLSYSFGFETINTGRFIRSHSSVKNHTRFQNKNEQSVYPVFRPTRPKNHTLWGDTYLDGLMAYIREYPPPPPGPFLKKWQPFLDPNFCFSGMFQAQLFANKTDIKMVRFDFRLNLI